MKSVYSGIEPREATTPTQLTFGNRPFGDGLA
jgi:hypothetical protein